MADEVQGSICPRHNEPAEGICDRCGRFACARCLRPQAELTLCSECHALPAVRLQASARAKWALAFALLGFHGVLPLLPVALWVARDEAARVGRGETPAAGRPYAQGALWIAAAGGVLWLGLGALALTKGAFR